MRRIDDGSSPLFMAVGRPGLNVQVSLLHTVLMVPLGVLFLWIDWGIEGVALAIVIAYACGFVYNMRRVLDILPLKAMDLVRNLMVLPQFRVEQVFLGVMALRRKVLAILQRLCEQVIVRRVAELQFVQLAFNDLQDLRHCGMFLTQTAHRDGHGSKFFAALGKSHGQFSAMPRPGN